MNFFDSEKNQNSFRAFTGIVIPTKNSKLCKFFLDSKCTKGDSCPFSHNIRGFSTDTSKLSSKDLIIKEIDDAIKYGRLDDIFSRMLTDEKEYEKYYNELHMKFRGISVMKLKNKSIIKEIINRVSIRDVKLNNTNLEFGYMPILFHFIVKGFAWNTFQGARDNVEYCKINECFDELVSQLQKTKVKEGNIPKYSDEEYDKMVIQSCSYVDSEDEENMIHTASHYLCDLVIINIKESFKNNKKMELIKENGEDNIRTMRIKLGEENFNKLLSTSFEELLNETTLTNKKAIDLYNIRKNNKLDVIEKYKEKCEKAIKRARGNQEAISEAKDRLVYNLMQFDRKLDIFYKYIFNNEIKFKKLIVKNMDDDKIFYNCLNNFLGLSNKFGTRCDENKLQDMLYLINTVLKEKKDEYLKLILEKIPDKLMNPLQIIQTFKKFNHIDSLWSFLLKSVSNKTAETCCVELLKQFFKEENRGLREGYIGEYLKKLSDIEISITTENKKILGLF